MHLYERRSLARNLSLSLHLSHLTSLLYSPGCSTHSHTPVHPLPSAQIAPNHSHSKMLSAMDPFHRCRLVVETAGRIVPQGNDFVDARHIANGDPEIITAFVARLFSTHNALTPPIDMLKPLWKAHNEAVEAYAELADILVAMGNEVRRQSNSVCVCCCPRHTSA